jgi:hypothetical protein
VYELSAKVKNPMPDKKVAAIVSRIKKLEAQIVSLESKKKTAPKKKAVQRKSRKQELPK